MTNPLGTLWRSRWGRFTDREQLECWRQARLAETLRRAPKRYRFYRGISGDCLDDFPIMDKATWLENFAGLNIAGVTLEQARAVGRRAEADRSFSGKVAGLSVGLSSGTSGRQGVFLTSRMERAHWAAAMIGRALPRPLGGRQRVAMVLRAGGPLYDSVSMPGIAFRFIDLLAGVSTQQRQLQDFGPTILAAPPAALDIYERAVRRGELSLRPRTIYSVADVLDDQLRDRLHATFQVTIGQIYQATEGFLGISCPQGTLHLNDDLVHVEREPVGGEPRRFIPVITDFTRVSQAIIRYRMGDVLVAAEKPCACESPLTQIDAIEGRADDMLRLPNAQGIPTILFADFIRNAILGAPGVDDFRLVHRHGVIELAVTPHTAWKSADRALRELCERQGLCCPDTVRTDFVVEPLAIKRRRVQVAD